MLAGGGGDEDAGLGVALANLVDHFLGDDFAGGGLEDPISLSLLPAQQFVEGAPGDLGHLVEFVVVVGEILEEDGPALQTEFIGEVLDVVEESVLPAAVEDAESAFAELFGEGLVRRRLLETVVQQVVVRLVHLLSAEVEDREDACGDEQD